MYALLQVLLVAVRNRKAIARIGLRRPSSISLRSQRSPLARWPSRGTGANTSATYNANVARGRSASCAFTHATCSCSAPAGRPSRALLRRCLRMCVVGGSWCPDTWPRLPSASSSGRYRLSGRKRPGAPRGAERARGSSARGRAWRHGPEHQGPCVTPHTHSVGGRHMACSTGCCGRAGEGSGRAIPLGSRFDEGRAAAVRLTPTPARLGSSSTRRPATRVNGVSEMCATWVPDTPQQTNDLGVGLPQRDISAS